MAIRQSRFITRNSDIVNRTLPTSGLLAGEALVNTADGIVYYSGITTSTNEWTPAGTGNTANYFEVGSNLYDLKLRNRITKYEDVEGAGLVGKFLSGTTDGFVLADIVDIADNTDSYTTGGTYNPTTDEITLNLNLGRPDVIITGVSNTFTTGVTWSPNTLTFGLNDGTTIIETIDTFTDLNVNNNLIVTGTTDLNGVSNYANDADGTQGLNEIINFGTLTGYVETNDTYVTGGTISVEASNDTNEETLGLFYKNSDGTPYTITLNNSFVTGGTLSGTTLILDKNDGSQTSGIDFSALDVNDTFVTGLTYNNSLLTLEQNEGESPLTVIIDEVSGLTVNDLTDGRVVYVGTGGKLVDEAGFEYNDTTDTLLAGNINTSAAGTAFVGTGGLTVGSGGDVNTPGTGDVVIHGNLTVFGDSITASTGELYVEDNNIILNYNPDNDTSSTSIGAGITIQDGDGSSNDVTLDIRPMNGFTGLTATEVPDITEYTGPNGYENRSFVTQLNDIVIRSTDPTIPNGVRVLAEFDILDGGTY